MYLLQPQSLLVEEDPAKMYKNVEPCILWKKKNENIYVTKKAVANFATYFESITFRSVGSNMN